VTGIKPAAADEDTLAGYPSLNTAGFLSWVVLGLGDFFLILPEFGKS